MPVIRENPSMTGGHQDREIRVLEGRTVFQTPAKDPCLRRIDDAVQRRPAREGVILRKRGQQRPMRKKVQSSQEWAWTSTKPRLGERVQCHDRPGSPNYGTATGTTTTNKKGQLCVVVYFFNRREGTDATVAIPLCQIKREENNNESI